MDSPVGYPMRNRLSLILVLLAALPAAGAAEPRAPDTQPAAASSIAAAVSHLALSEGAAHRLLVTAALGDGFDQDVTDRSAFSSDRPEIASVDAHGSVRGMSAGTCVITSSFDGKSAQTHV